jgi:hypothetical protein
VAANWILDTAEFNEWMNEEDYEIDEDLVNIINSIFQLNIQFSREEIKEESNLRIVYQEEKHYLW